MQLFEKLEIHMNGMDRTLIPCPEQILCKHQQSLDQINQRSGDSPTCLAQREMPANLNSVFLHTWTQGPWNVNVAHLT